MRGASQEVRKGSSYKSLSNSLLIASHSFCRTLINRGESGSASLFNQRLLLRGFGGQHKDAAGEQSGGGDGRGAGRGAAAGEMQRKENLRNR